MNAADHYLTRYLEAKDLDQYNALLRYTFQVTEEELTATGWKDDEIKQSKFPVLERADVLGCFDGDTLVSQFAVYPLKMNIYDTVYHVGFVTSVCTYPEYTGQGIMTVSYTHLGARTTMQPFWGCPGRSGSTGPMRTAQWSTRTGGATACSGSCWKRRCPLSGPASDVYKRQVARQYKEHDLPLDMICMDIDYMQDYADFTVNKERFPDLAKLSADLPITAMSHRREPL